MQSMMILLCSLLLAAQPSTAPVVSEDAQYTQTLNKRADDIVKKLQIADPATAQKVHDVLVTQYRNLRDIHAKRDARLKEIPKDNKERIDQTKAETSAELKTLHERFLGQLQPLLTSQQIDAVKDGMTYNVLNVTYTAYQQMIPRLTEEQKSYILAQLTEARELAMDGGSSEEKHGIFGKYKGRINNYLSQQGYNLKEEEAGWRERRKAATQQAQ